jgi:SAM-dependent methyltransferase
MQVPVALQSLLIQIAAALPLALVAALRPFETAPPLWLLALVQGSVAALLSRAWRQPPWWQPLHFGFLPLAWLAHGAGAPSWVYLAAFVALLLVYWTAFRTRVPLYLSDRKAWQAIEVLLPQERPFRFIDLGSGLGGAALYLAARCPNGAFAGVEVAPAPWLVSRVRAWLGGGRVSFLRRDYAGLDLGDFDVVFAFLSPAAMPRLWQQAQAQMRPGSLFVSLSFGVPGQRPHDIVPLADGARHTLYTWRM